jgi:hypothetical protein
MKCFTIVNMDSIHLAAFNAITASCTGNRVKAYKKGGRYPTGRMVILLNGAKRSATATAASAYKQSFLGIARLQNKTNLFSMMENCQGFIVGDGSTPILTYTSFSGHTKAHAALFGFVTRLAKNTLFLTADTIINCQCLLLTN